MNLDTLFGRNRNQAEPSSLAVPVTEESIEPQIEPQVEPPAEKPISIEGVVTDQKILDAYYRRQGIDAHPIATDSFIGKSRETYNAAWLSRELIQNFVDHNPEHPGTLDGVEIEEVELEDGIHRFTLRGNWPFKDPTGVLSPHSEKPADLNTAGGNGIGLKQAAIRLMRDFEAERFSIEGESWAVDYNLAKAEEVNRALQLDERQQLRHDWLVATMEVTPNQGSNCYTIETANPELITCLGKLRELGVSKKNPYLYNQPEKPEDEPISALDFESPQGGLRWLPADQQGRLYINGQVMNFGTQGETSEDYWVGPQGVTLQLNNLSYKMSVDRPPISKYELPRHLRPLIESMTKEDIVRQLLLSEPLWGRDLNKASYEKDGYEVVVE